MKLHLGCGKRFLPGYIHIDLADFPHIDYRASIDRLPMIPDASVELIYCSHAFEYFDREEAARVLGEWRRALKDGGILRLAVPDFEALAALYRDHGRLDEILGPLFGRITIEAPSGAMKLYHRTAYDFPSLEKACIDAGFDSVRRFDWRVALPAGFDDFSQAYHPHMDKDGGRLLSLNVEATK